MKPIPIAILALFLFGQPVYESKSQNAGSYAISAVPFTSVHVNDSFWAPKIRNNHDVTIPIAISKSRETGRIRNFMIAGKQAEGSFCSLYPFDDSDVYKIIEGASYSLQTFPDPQLSATLDTLVNYIRLAQEPDGYLYTNRTIDSNHMHEWVGKKRWEKDPELSHELYNLGHLYEAAVAHYQATGKRDLLDVAIKSANLVYNDFIGKQLTYYPGHQVIEMGLVRLYGVTGETKYLELAEYMLKIRRGGETYNQAHKPVTEQDRIVGHAVRATYMYSGMADVASMTGNKAYTGAIDKIWEDLLCTKFYITGGIGSGSDNEGFGDPYYLPNLSAYCETCASIGNVFWNHRMFLLHGDSKYVDVLERTLYNALLSGVSLSGDRFFYPNPLKSHGQHKRSAWFGCACCPANLCRFIPSVPGYIYATDATSLYVNLYIQNQADIYFNSAKISLIQKTRYPWEGTVELTLDQAERQEFTLNLRIPGWARGETVPCNLYHFVDSVENPVTILINGKPAGYTMKNGYAMISRNWSPGDRIELNLPMPIRYIAADFRIEADRDRIALQRGPLVYCLEWPDNPNGHVFDLVFDKVTGLKTDFNPKLLGGVEVITGTASVAVSSSSGNKISGTTDFTAIPYYLWANRSPGDMSVWLPVKASAAHPAPLPTLASTSRVSGSKQDHSLRAVHDQDLPSASSDPEVPYHHWWPQKDTTVWIRYDFEKKSRVSACSVYWFDDGPQGGCRIPQSWQILYRSGEEWIPVKTIENYPVVKDQLNKIRFSPVTTTSLKLEVRLQKEFSSGIYEWMVDNGN